MEITVRKNITYNAALLYVDAGVRYWEDGLINGKEDIDCETIDGEPQMPCASLATSNEHHQLRGQQWRWRPVINLESGKIINWDYGVSAKIHYKVCDDFAMEILDDTGKLVGRYEDYVPRIMSPAEDFQGDYIAMNISTEGFIENWQSSQIESILEYLVDYKEPRIPVKAYTKDQFAWWLEYQHFDSSQVFNSVPECIANAQYSYDHLEAGFEDFTPEDKETDEVPWDVNIGKVEHFDVRAALRGAVGSIVDQLDEAIGEFASYADCEGECDGPLNTKDYKAFEDKVVNALYPIVTHYYGFYPEMRANPFKCTYNLKEHCWNDAPKPKEEPK